MTTEGSLVPGIRRHFIRIHPVDVNDPRPDENANRGILELRNQPPGAPTAYPAKDIVDAGFLELVRYGIREPGDPLIEDSLRVVDAVLKVDTPFGPCWRRYNHDGYGQREDGTPYQGWGKGHAWPLLTGERGHYELAAGRDWRPFLRAMEGFATSVKLLPEQVWSDPDRPDAHMYFGRPTGGPMPLLWAHAEYLKLVRSAADGQVFDLIPEVADRYRNRRKAPTSWKSGNSIDRCGACRPVGPCGFRQRLRFNCTGRATNGSRQTIRVQRPRVSKTINLWTSSCHRSSGLQSASPSSGRPWGTGKGGTSRSALAGPGRPEGDGQAVGVELVVARTPASLHRSGRSPRSPGGRTDSARKSSGHFDSERGVDRTIKGTALSGPEFRVPLVRPRCLSVAGPPTIIACILKAPAPPGDRIMSDLIDRRRFLGSLL